MTRLTSSKAPRWYPGHPIGQHERGVWLAELQGDEIGLQGTWQLFARGAGRSAGRYLALKLFAKGMALAKANYWVTWNLETRRFVKAGSKDLFKLQEGRPLLFDCVTKIVEQLFSGLGSADRVFRRLQTLNVDGIKAPVCPEFFAIRGLDLVSGVEDLGLVEDLVDGIESLLGDNTIHKMPVFRVPVQAKMRNVDGIDPRICENGVIPPQRIEHPENKNWWAAYQVCARGHFAPRRKYDNSCVECMRLTNRLHMRKKRKVDTLPL